LIEKKSFIISSK